jgi:hypothetical protein
MALAPVEFVAIRNAALRYGPADQMNFALESTPNEAHLITPAKLVRCLHFNKVCFLLRAKAFPDFSSASYCDFQ